MVVVQNVTYIQDVHSLNDFLCLRYICTFNTQNIQIWLFFGYYFAPFWTFGYNILPLLLSYLLMCAPTPILQYDVPGPQLSGIYVLTLVVSGGRNGQGDGTLETPLERYYRQTQP